MRILALGHQLSENSTGRAYSLWLIARELGWEFTLAGPASDGLWPPLRDTPFSRHCRVLDPSSNLEEALQDEAAVADLLLAVKPLPESLGVALQLRQATGKPLLVDVDDPDVEVRTPVNSIRQAWRVAKNPATRRRYATLWALRRKARSLSVMTSSPSLQRRYGGVVVPHVREECPVVRHDGDRPTVAFVGTALPHKGIEVLRRAVARLADTGYSLEVTDEAPADALPHESWRGRTTIGQGQEILHRSDIVAIPSLNLGYGPAQLPVKLIDAMMAGQAIVASDLPPMRWALGDGGILFPPGDEDALVSALLRLREPEVRRSHGERAHRHALGRFTPSAVQGVFVDAARRAGADV